MKKNSREAGQALTELVLILPVFFLVIGGGVLLTLQKKRAYSDGKASLALAMSESSFGDSERREGHWSEVSSSTVLGSSLREKISELVLNGSPSPRSDQISVLVDKNISGRRLGEECRAGFQISKLSPNPSASTLSTLETCADDTGYEATGVRFVPKQTLAQPTGFISDFQGIKKTSAFTGIYLYSDEFLFHTRGTSPIRVFRKVENTFRQEVASFDASSEAQDFNQSCQMDYLKKSDCTTPSAFLGDTSPYAILEVIKKETSAAQKAACLVEACGFKCVNKVALAFVAGAVSLQWLAGSPPALCPKVRTAVIQLHNQTMSLIQDRVSAVEKKESSQRSRLR